MRLCLVRGAQVMKCPKCHYVSHDYLDACRKCGIDLVISSKTLGCWSSNLACWT